MAILGSREQMCIHDEVRSVRGRAQNNACHYVCRKRLCRHHSLVSGLCFPIFLIMLLKTILFSLCVCVCVVRSPKKIGLSFLLSYDAVASQECVKNVLNSGDCERHSNITVYPTEFVLNFSAI